MPSVDLDERRADLILAHMSDVLRTADGSDDLECNATFCRSGPIADYALGDGSIDDAAELAEVAALPFDIKVVLDINFCGHPRAANGCRVGDTIIVRLVGLSDTLNGINWAHEYGHVVGLNHRSDPRALMTEGTLPDSRSVNSRECTAFREGAAAAGF